MVEAQAEQLVRKALKDVGYGTADNDIDPATCLVELAFNSQAAEISAAVDGSAILGAGD